MQVEQSRAESAAEDMTVQNLFDLLADEDPDELDSEARWNKVYEVLPWLLKMLWAFFEDYDGPEQTAVSIAWGPPCTRRTRTMPRTCSST